MFKDLTEDDARMECVAMCPINETVSFNPSIEEDVQALLNAHGPEGLYHIARVLMNAADEDMSEGIKQATAYVNEEGYHAAGE